MIEFGIGFAIGFAIGLAVQSYRDRQKRIKEAEDYAKAHPK